MIDFKDYLEMGMEFHGHKCPAMPLGIRAGSVAMNKLGVARSMDKELSVIAETGKGHAAGCFLDGIMAVTGCTYGKSNIEKLYYNKMAFTLIDNKTGRSVRVSLKPEFFAKTLNSPFVQQRKKGILPQDISSDIADPLVDKVLTIPDDVFLEVGDVKEITINRKKGVFEAKPCAVCGEMTFIDKLVESEKGQICLACNQNK